MSPKASLPPSLVEAIGWLEVHLLSIMTLIVHLILLLSHRPQRHEFFFLSTLLLLLLCLLIHVQYFVGPILWLCCTLNRLLLRHFLDWRLNISGLRSLQFLDLRREEEVELFDIVLYFWLRFLKSAKLDFVASKQIDFFKCVVGGTIFVLIFGLRILRNFSLNLIFLRMNELVLLWLFWLHFIEELLLFRFCLGLILLLFHWFCWGF